MKKSKFFITSFMISLLLCSCGNKSLPSDKAVDCAEKTIDCSNEFIAGDLSHDEYMNKLDEITDALSYVTEPGDEENNPNHVKDLYVNIDIHCIKTSAISYNLGKEDKYIDEIKNNIEDLKELIYK